jgi:hypothetical protein
MGEENYKLLYIFMLGFIAGIVLFYLLIHVL